MYCDTKGASELRYNNYTLAPETSFCWLLPLSLYHVCIFPHTIVLFIIVILKLLAEVTILLFQYYIQHT